MEFYSLITNYGLNRQINALSNKETIKLTKMAVGSGNGEISQNQTALGEKKHEFLINSIEVDESNKNQLIATGVVTSDVGGFYIREVGVFDDKDQLFAIAKIAPTYKPLLSEGSAKDLTIKFYLQVENTNNIELKIDPSVVIATRKWVADNLSQKADKLDVYSKQQSDEKFWSDIKTEFKKEPNGYVKLPNGFILQWGATDNPKGDDGKTADSFKTMHFPIAFPNRCLSVNLSDTLGYAVDRNYVGAMIRHFDNSSFVFDIAWDEFDYIKFGIRYKKQSLNGFYHYIAIGF